MSHYSRILYIFLKRYIGIWIYYFIPLFYKKCVCVSVCVQGGHWMGVRQSGRLSEASLTHFMCGVTDFWKRQEPFLLPLLSSMFQPIKVEITSELMVDCRLKKLHKIKWKYAVFRRRTRKFKRVKFTTSLVISTDGLKSERDVQLPVPAG